MKKLQELAKQTGETVEQVAARLLEQQSARRWRIARAMLHALKREE